MPKIIELTVELDVNKVSCPGVWLCQNGRVNLTVYALGTSYQTCMLPPIFPLLFKDVFYFRKRFQQSCALNNISCVLKDEIIFCELILRSDSCPTNSCTILAQYLGSLNDLLFPPYVCSNDGVDLLMRRTNEFPGILSPKIEVSTKVRIDELWSSSVPVPCYQVKTPAPKPCECTAESGRQKQVCHSANYHSIKCERTSKSQPRYPSESSKTTNARPCPSPPRARSPRPANRPFAATHNSPLIYTAEDTTSWNKAISCDDVSGDYEDQSYPCCEEDLAQTEEKLHNSILESRCILPDSYNHCNATKERLKVCPTSPCNCEICRRYHELFHSASE